MIRVSRLRLRIHFSLIAGSALLLHATVAFAAPKAPTSKTQPLKAPALKTPSSPPNAPASGSATTSVRLLDAIVASVDDTPITLSDVSKRLRPPRTLTIQDAKNDPEFRQVLDAVIMEQLIRQEAADRKLGVSSAEIEEYVAEVAKRNNMNHEEFAAALAGEGKSLPEYRVQVELDILRSKLASSLARGATAVSDEEVRAHLNSGHKPAKKGAVLKLRQILITTNTRDPEEARRLAESLRQRAKDGEDFSDLATEFSESPEAQEGGLLGEIAESDMSGAIYDAIFKLDEGEVSEVTETPSGYHIFFIQSRTVPDDDEEENDESDEDDEAHRKEAEAMRESLKEAKLQSKLAEYFTTELYKLHSVDKKL